MQPSRHAARPLWSPDFPFRPAHLPFFYGWVILLVATLGVVASIPGQTMGMGIFNEPIMAALDLERSEVSLAYLLGTLGGGLALPFGGRLFDLWGARRMIVVSSCGLGLALLFLAGSSAVAGGLESLAARLPVRPALALPPLVALFVGFFLVRLFGQGLVTMTSRAVLGKWFERRRDLVFAISGTATSVCFASAPPILKLLILNLGWQGAFLLLAAIIGIGFTLLGWLFFRDNPEECGLLMDGADTGHPSKRRPNLDNLIRRDYTRAEALKTPAFWIFNLALAFNAFFITAYTFHIEAIGRESGVGPEILNYFLPAAVLGIAANFGAGWMASRTRLKYVLAAYGLASLIAVVGVLLLPTLAGKLLLIVGLGATGGFFAILSGIVWPRFFGRKHLGAISSVNAATLVFASATSPYLFAEADRLLGGFQPAFWAVLPVPAALAVISMWADNPQRRLPPDQGDDDSVRIAV